MELKRRVVLKYAQVFRASRYLVTTEESALDHGIRSQTVVRTICPIREHTRKSVPMINLGIHVAGMEKRLEQVRYLGCLHF